MMTPDHVDNFDATSADARPAQLRAKRKHAGAGSRECRQDPLLTAIHEFKHAMAIYDTHPLAGTDDDADVAEQTYLPALRALERWTTPAETRDGAMAALELAKGDLDHSMNHSLVSAMVGAAFAFFENGSPTATDLNSTFSGAIAAMDRHTRMEALYDALAHLSDALSGLVSRPRMSEDGPGAEALEALDDFIMDQMDAVKNRALAVQSVEWHDEESRIALLLKHIARFRIDADHMAPIVAQLSADLVAIRSPA